MTLEKQPDWIDKVIGRYSFIMGACGINLDQWSKDQIRNSIEEHLPKEDTYQKGYQKGREDMKREITKIYNKYSKYYYAQETVHDCPGDVFEEIIEDLEGYAPKKKIQDKPAIIGIKPLSPTDTK